MVTLIIDGNSYVHGFWAADGSVERPAEFLRSLIDAYRSAYKADVMVCFDGPGKTWRHDRFPDYKTGRDQKPPELFKALDLARVAMQEMDVFQVDVPGYEADDVVAVLATEQLAAGGKVVIFSRDKDYHQMLVPGRLTILKKANRTYGRWAYEYYTATNLREEYELDPAQWPDYRALTGDPSDAWPGCPGIGDVAAKKILHHAGSLAAAMELATNRPFALPLNAKQRTALAAFDWQLGLELMTLRRSIPEVTKAPGYYEATTVPF